ncbi:hypothetical protein [Microbacterium sp.]|uniref:hypothetical protein n=1 Tax=Microbacterium sp. TaxID=51671 RepID=UPI002811D439|nr:hypothetical protein [Microbacterium sp.]
MFIGAALAGALLGGASAEATNWSGATSYVGCHQLNKADSAAHGYYYSSLNSANTAAMNWARVNVIDPTDVNTYNDAHNAQTDVVVFDGNFATYCGLSWYSSTNTSGIVGLATCVSLSGASCEQHQIYLHEPWTSSKPADFLQALASHESGHTLGLAHRSSGSTSMQVGYPKPSRYYDGHDWSHLNAAY